MYHIIYAIYGMYSIRRDRYVRVRSRVAAVSVCTMRDKILTTRIMAHLYCVAHDC